jgi:hypothetical protein
MRDKSYPENLPRRAHLGLFGRSLLGLGIFFLPIFGRQRSRLEPTIHPRAVARKPRSQSK